MVPEAYIELIKKLSQKTKRGEVNWQKTAAENKYLLDFKTFSLTIEFYSGGLNPSTIYVELWDGNGKKIDGFSVSDDGDSGWFDTLDEIYNIARRKALRIDEAINLITKELDTLQTVGAEPDDDFVAEPDDDVPM